MCSKGMKSISSSSIFIEVGAKGLERELFPPAPITCPELPSLILVIIDSMLYKMNNGYRICYRGTYF